MKTKNPRQQTINSAVSALEGLMALSERLKVKLSASKEPLTWSERRVLRFALSDWAGEVVENLYNNLKSGRPISEDLKVLEIVSELTKI